ncbi:MAG: ATP-binding protein, partial [Rheinheimera sp.]|nr:ATP-binding protein [Rheinheimera sp.]
MDITELQAKLPELTHLLPSQREWLERLLFQLAFNDCQQVFIVGASGSGKSTLAMALAELFSIQYNIALLTSTTDESQVAAQLMQQWFAGVGRSDVPLAQQIATGQSASPLLLIVDDAERYSDSLMQQLSALPCVRFYFAEQSPNNAGLTLTLNKITAADAQILLEAQALNSIELSERIAQANGNMHRLLQPVEQSSISRRTDDTASSQRPLKSALFGASAIAVAVLVYALWPAADNATPGSLPQVTAKTPPVVVDPATQPTLDSETPGDVVSDVGQSQPVTPAELAVQMPPEDTAASSAVSEHLKVNAAAETEPQPEPEPEPEPDPSVASDVEAAADNESLHSAEKEAEAANAEQVIFVHDEQQLLDMPKQQLAIQLAVLSSEAALQRFNRTYPQLAALSYQRN